MIKIASTNNILSEKQLELFHKGKQAKLTCLFYLQASVRDSSWSDPEFDHPYESVADAVEELRGAIANMFECFKTLSLNLT